MKALAAPISGFPGYRATSDGKIQSIHRRGTKVFAKKWRDLKPSTDAKGYLGLTICANKRRRKARVHRLIAEAFLPNPKNLPCVRHLDGGRTNNKLSNLAWGTYVENEHDKHAHGTWDLRRNGKLDLADRTYVRVRSAMGDPAKNIAKKLGVSWYTVQRIIKGTTWATD